MKRVTLFSMAMCLVALSFFTISNASAEGTMKETADFSIMVPDGWKFSDFNNGTIQTYNGAGTYMVQIEKAGMNMTEQNLLDSMAGLVKRYEGTEPEKVEMQGLTFYKTTYEANGRSQSQYSALKDGSKITISLMGKDHQNDPKIQSVMESIVIK
ncbi:hypothetical protein [Thiorhodovibrio frisius]|uniref:Uncharacterized protein n=1 Tax=Thiorhodovibrio frisius TaxID=631362 RepID=H8YX26_9GAMM|nr:hypothetical protein [Thiorhodovibrio frisius]EIC23002.1 hypothetical protein Thi970DRAFT_00651 [Thiorhodovibrio frisius]WPL22732.1 hypothetical protein Thiofri_02902 [Thiorhodovibrio frisius]